MAETALQRTDERTQAVIDIVAELATMEEPRRHLAGLISGLDVHDDLGEGDPLPGCRMPDLILLTADGPMRVFESLHKANPLLLDLGEPDDLDIAPWSERATQIDARTDGPWSRRSSAWFPLSRPLDPSRWLRRVACRRSPVRAPRSPERLVRGDQRSDAARTVRSGRERLR